MGPLRNLNDARPGSRPWSLCAEWVTRSTFAASARVRTVILAIALLGSFASSAAEERVTVVVLPLAAASGMDETSDLGPLGSLVIDPATLSPGDKVYVEAWCQATGPRGITTAVVDLMYDTTVFDTTFEQVSLSLQWGLLAFNRSVNEESGLVDNLGGNNLSGLAVAPNWARIGTIEFDVKGDPGPVQFCAVFAGQSQGGFPLTFAILQEGAVDPGAVAYGCAAIGCTADADCGDPLYCNGPELCIEGICASAGDPCVGQWCDEGADTCRDYGDGDFDLDGRVDLRDAAEAQVCFGAFALPDCNPANLTGDGFIRLEDFAEFVALLSGP